MARLVAYDFPGNVRELRNLIERASILARGRGDRGRRPAARRRRSGRAGDGPDAFVQALPETVDLAATMTLVERGLVPRALASADGVQAEAARRLGISRSLLAYKLKALGSRRTGPRPTADVKET